MSARPERARRVTRALLRATVGDGHWRSINAIVDRIEHLIEAFAAGRYYRRFVQGKEKLEAQLRRMDEREIVRAGIAQMTRVTLAHMLEPGFAVVRRRGEVKEYLVRPPTPLAAARTDVAAVSLTEDMKTSATGVSTFQLRKLVAEAPPGGVSFPQVVAVLGPQLKLDAVRAQMKGRKYGDRASRDTDEQMVAWYLNDQLTRLVREKVVGRRTVPYYHPLTPEEAGRRRRTAPKFRRRVPVPVLLRVIGPDRWVTSEEALAVIRAQAPEEVPVTDALLLAKEYLNNPDPDALVAAGQRRMVTDGFQDANGARVGEGREDPDGTVYYRLFDPATDPGMRAYLDRAARRAEGRRPRPRKEPRAPKAP